MSGHAATAQAAGQHWGAEALHVRRDHHEVLHDISFSVEPSETQAVLGGDGSGKTTLLRAMVGWLATSAGRVLRPDERALGYVSAAPGGYPDLTVGENLEFSGRSYGLSGADQARRAAELLEQTQLGPARDRLAEHLSGGMRRKLAMAMAVMHRPQLLVLDEPTTGVDPVGRAEIARLLGSLAVQGTAIVLSTSYLDEAERADHVLVLAGGEMLLSGTPDGLVAAMPGVIAESDTRPANVPAWLRGRSWRAWYADAGVPDGSVRVDTRLEDAVIVAQLQREQAQVAA